MSGEVELLTKRALSSVLGHDSAGLVGRSQAPAYFYPEDYGTVVVDGTTTTGNAAAIQAAIDACDANRGGVVKLRPERYAIDVGLVVNNQGTIIEGAGMPGAAGANGSARIVAADGIDGITFNAASSGSGHKTLGYGMRNVHVVAASGATTGNGVIVQNAENFLADNLNVSGFIGGTGLRIDGKASNAQYAMLINFCAGDNLKSLHLKGTGPNGCRMLGGFLQGAGTTPRVSSIGIHVETGDTFRGFGVVIQGYETGYYQESSAKGSELHGPRFEFCNINLRIGAGSKNFALHGGTMVNSILVNTGAGSIGIQVDAGATDTFLTPTNIAGTVTPIADSGTNTIVQGIYGAVPGTITASANTLAADVAMATNGTFYDGPSLSLAAGTWLVWGHVTILCGSSAIRSLTAKLWDGSTEYSRASHTVPGTATAAQVTLSVEYKITLGSTTTIKISATSSVNSETLKGTTSPFSTLVAIKVA